MSLKPRKEPLVWECDLEGCERTILRSPGPWWKAEHPPYASPNRRSYHFCSPLHLLLFINGKPEGCIVHGPIKTPDYWR